MFKKILRCCYHCVYIGVNNVNSAVNHWVFFKKFFRYNEDLELEDAIHTAILTLKVSSVSNSWICSDCIINCLENSNFSLPLDQESFEGQMTEDNIEVGICNEAGFRRLTPTEVKDYLAAIA